jgi:hypothetical protein
MGRFARVTSIGVLQTTAAALQRFRGEAAGVMDDLETEVRRALEWIHHDRKDYWAQELRRSAEAVSAARNQLQQARTSRRIVGHEPACIDEQRALDRAKRRLEMAEQKVLAVKHFALAIDRAVDEFQRSRAQFATWLDTDLLQAVAVLDRMSQSLESYVSLAAPADSATTPPLMEEAGDKGSSWGGSCTAAPDSVEGTGVQLPSQRDVSETPDAENEGAGP